MTSICHCRQVLRLLHQDILQDLGLPISPQSKREHSLQSLLLNLSEITPFSSMRQQISYIQIRYGSAEYSNPCRMERMSAKNQTNNVVLEKEKNS